MTTAADIELALNDLSVLLDGALPLLGHAELVPIANLVTGLGEKLTEAIAAKLAAAPALAAEIAAGEAAADAAEAAKLKGSP